MDDDDLRDLFDSLPRIAVKRLFGGKGVWADGIIVGLVTHGILYLKGDGDTAERFREAGSTQWSYRKGKTGKSVPMPYWTVPESALDDRDEMAEWARLAYEAASRARR